ncbi:MAG: ASCH domain-containing protein [Terracidiphilus sp.]
MKTLTLTQPWASLVAIGAKQIETRSWTTAFRGRLAIHAAKGFPKWAKEFAGEPPVSVLFGMNYEYPRGAIVATCRLVSVLPTRELQKNGVIRMDDTARCPDFELTEQERDFGDYEPGRYAWLLADIKPVSRPIIVNGALGLWEFQGWETGELCI